MLEPIGKRKGANSTVRKRDRSGNYTYGKSSMVSLNSTARAVGKMDDLSPTQKQDERHGR